MIRAGGSSKYWLGTDQLGRDILSRIIYGARISLLAAAITLGVGGSIGVVLGLVAGWFGGVMDEAVMRFVDILLAIPLVLIALAMVATLGTSLWIIVAVLTIFIWPRFARQLRGEVLQLKNMDFVALARVAGASVPRILFIHIFPGTINTLIVVATLQVGIVILLEATLSFLGAGVPPPTATWGRHGVGRAESPGRRVRDRVMVDFHLPRHRHRTDGDVSEPLRRLAARQAGPTAAADRVEPISQIPSPSGGGLGWGRPPSSGIANIGAHSRAPLLV